MVVLDYFIQSANSCEKEFDLLIADFQKVKNDLDEKEGKLNFREKLIDECRAVRDSLEIEISTLQTNCKTMEKKFKRVKRFGVFGL